MENVTGMPIPANTYTAAAAAAAASAAGFDFKDPSRASSDDLGMRHLFLGMRKQRKFLSSF